MWKLKSVFLPFMTPNEYNALKIDDRATLLWDKGQHLETWYDYGKFRILLYVLGDMFVEVYYKLDSNNIHEIKAWQNMPVVGRVLEGIFMN